MGCVFRLVQAEELWFRGRHCRCRPKCNLTLIASDNLQYPAKDMRRPKFRYSLCHACQWWRELLQVHPCVNLTLDGASGVEGLDLYAVLINNRANRKGTAPQKEPLFRGEKILYCWSRCRRYLQLFLSLTIDIIINQAIYILTDYWKFFKIIIIKKCKYLFVFYCFILKCMLY